ncbi:MAG: PilZ domain-containing protein [Elusimicrobia bacterium]|nr:PilZ domain-containing protein [Elusimicrobiota bacterium]
MSGGADKRKHQRHKKDAPLILLEKSGASAVRDGAILRDVSLGGLAFETTLDMQPGEQFEFALYVPSRGWVDGKGVVCWVKTDGKHLICGASIDVREWDQQKLLDKWLHPANKGILKFFFPGKGVKPPTGQS